MWAALPNRMPNRQVRIPVLLPEARAPIFSLGVPYQCCHFSGTIFYVGQDLNNNSLGSIALIYKTVQGVIWAIYYIN